MYKAISVGEQRAHGREDGEHKLEYITAKKYHLSFLGELCVYKYYSIRAMLMLSDRRRWGMNSWKVAESAWVASPCLCSSVVSPCSDLYSASFLRVLLSGNHYAPKTNYFNF